MGITGESRKEGERKGRQWEKNIYTQQRQSLKKDFCEMKLLG